MRFLLLFFFCFSYGLDPQEIFVQANTAYQKNECLAALKLYDLIPQKGSVIWYNMGNCAYKLNDQIKALLYWKRAYKNANRDMKQNIVANVQKLTLANASLTHPTSPLVMQILFFCIFGIFLIVAYFLIHARRWILLAMSISVLVSAGHITYKVCSTSVQALVMYDEVALRAGPSIEYHQIDSISAGTTVIVLKQKDGWSQIATGSGKGWVDDKQIEKI